MRSLTLALTLATLLTGACARQVSSPYVKDVEFALEEIPKQCGHFFRLKGIDWKRVSREFLQEARRVQSDQDHLVLLTRLLARLQDGHARVVPLEKGKEVSWPDTGPYAMGERPRGPGMFWCTDGRRILVKNAWSAAADSGVTSGMEVVMVDKEPAGRWLQARIAQLRDLRSFSTDQQALYSATHWGLGAPTGTRMKLELRTVEGKKKTVTLTYRNASVVPVGPVFPPEGLETLGRQSYGKTPAGNGYIHLRDVPGELPEQLDRMLAALGPVPGLILDFRANGGGGCDHDAVFGRFVPAGKTFMRPSAGPNPYGGPVVVIVDAGVRSAGETVSGQLKEDGRAYMIGESATAGMSSSKTTIELPSGLFGLYVSVASNKQRFNKGQGIEGIGVPPHEVVPYAAEDLAAGVDTQIRRAEELLADFPRKAVRYDPARYGWPP